MSDPVIKFHVSGPWNESKSKYDIDELARYFKDCICDVPWETYPMKTILTYTGNDAEYAKFIQQELENDSYQVKRI